MLFTTYNKLQLFKEDIKYLPTAAKVSGPVVFKVRETKPATLFIKTGNKPP